MDEIEIIKELVSITNDENFPEEFRSELKEELLEIRNEIESLIILYS